MRLLLTLGFGMLAASEATAFCSEPPLPFCRALREPFQDQDEYDRCGHWRKCAGDRPVADGHNATDAETFFRDLEIDNPDLLDFECLGIKLEVIEGWLVDEGLVS